MTLIFKIVPENLWAEAERAGRFDGSPVDRIDGFIHFSAADQVAETAAKHFDGHPDLLIVAVDSAELGDSLRWEPSRGGSLFPHLYAPLGTEAVAWIKPFPLGADARHMIDGLMSAPSA